MAISRLQAACLALVMHLLCVSFALGREHGLAHYSNTRPPLPQQPSGPPQPARDRPGPGPSVGDEPPSGIDAPGPEFANVEDIEIFAPADISTYGAGIPPNTGWWASWDWLRWTVSAPERTIIGNEAVYRTYNTGSLNYYGTTLLGGANGFRQLGPMDTGFIGDGPSNGYRWEGGWMDKHHGFLLSGFKLYANDQQAIAQNVGVPFAAPPEGPYGISLLQGFVRSSAGFFDADLNGNGIFGRYGPNPSSGSNGQFPGSPDFGDLATLPVNFTSMVVQDHREVWGCEADYVWRLRPGFHSWTWEVLGGVRFLRWDEQFLVVGSGGTLDYSYWNTRSINNMIGGQVGVRMAHRRNRLMFTTEGRFAAMGNLQNNQQDGLIAGLNIPGGLATIDGRSLNLAPTGWNTAVRVGAFSPLGELRFNLQYQIFNKASLNIGWTGMVVGGVSRPMNIINYTLPNMGVITNDSNNRQTVFMQGLTLGVIFNR